MMWLAVVAVLVIIIAVLWLRLQRERRSNFSPDQYAMVKGLLDKELERVRGQQQTAIDQAAKDGKTVSWDGALKHVEELVARYKAEGRNEEAQTVAKVISDFRSKYPPEIPVDVAFRAMKELEEKTSTSR